MDKLVLVNKVPAWDLKGSCMKSFARVLGLSSVAALFFACAGDEVTNIYESGMDVIASGDDFPKCKADNQGKLVFSSDSGKAYFCNNGKWNLFVGEAEKGEAGADGKSCTAKSIKEGVEISCGKDIIDTLTNGKDGKDGVGEKGADGKSCTAKSIKEGVEISCGDTVIDTLTNGQNGKDGQNASVSDDSASSATVVSGGCSIYSDDDGVVVFDCDGTKYTIHKAECEGVAFDPTTSFCLAGKVTPLKGKCGKKDIDMTKQFCDTRDSSVYGYTVVQYNGFQQVWMAQDLNYEAEDSELQGEGASSRLYSWYSAMDGKQNDVGYKFYKGICPDGWHIPTKDDALTLADYDGKLMAADSYSSNIAAGFALKDSVGWDEYVMADEVVSPGSNELGFAARQMGYINEKKQRSDVAFAMWTASSNGDGKAWIMMISQMDVNVLFVDFDKMSRASVRCLMDY